MDTGMMSLSTFPRHCDKQIHSHTMWKMKTSGKAFSPAAIGVAVY